MAPGHAVIDRPGHLLVGGLRILVAASTVSIVAAGPAAGQSITFRTLTPLADCGLYAIRVVVTSPFTDPRGEHDRDYRVYSRELDDAILLDRDDTEFTAGQLLYPPPAGVLQNEYRGILFTYYLTPVKSDGSEVEGPKEPFFAQRLPVLIGKVQVEGSLRVAPSQRFVCSPG